MKRTLLSLVLLWALYPGAALAAQLPSSEVMRPVGGPIVTAPVFGGSALGLPGRGVTSAPYGGEALVGAQFLGPAHLGIMSVNVLMQMRDEAGLQRYASMVSNPSSLYYRRFLTPQQVADFYGAPAADYSRAAQYFWNQGLGIKWWTQREMLRVVGPQANMERALQTHFGEFKKNGVVFYAPMTPPTFATRLAVRGLGGLVTYHRFRKHFDIGRSFVPFQGFGPGLLVGNSPFELAAAFDYTGAYNLNGTCCKGDGITIGIVGTGPISTADVPFFRSLFSVAGTGGASQVDVTAVMPCCYSSGLTTPPPVTAPCGGFLPGCNPEDVEAQLDTEHTSALAPNAQVNFYLAYNPNECFAPGACAPGAGSAQLGIGETDDELQQIANDNVADVVSGSYGIGERDFASSSNPLLTCPAATPSGCSGADPAIFATMAAQGIAVFLSSGDTGASGCQRDTGSAFADKLCVSYPSDDVSVVSVGGTTTPIGTDGRLTGPVTTWGVQTQTFGASGGGFSLAINRPAFEPAGSKCASNGACDSTHRLQPDLSLNADLATGDAVTINCGTGPSCAGLGGAQIGAVGGTSASAPAMAAMWALVLEACKQTPSCNTGPAGHTYRLGNPAPLLYGLSASAKAAAFYDIVYGRNGVPPLANFDYSVVNANFKAVTGFDLATGIGAPFARNLIKAVVGI